MTILMVGVRKLPRGAYHCTVTPRGGGGGPPPWAVVGTREKALAWLERIIRGQFKPGDEIHVDPWPGRDVPMQESDVDAALDGLREAVERIG